MAQESKSDDIWDSEEWKALSDHATEIKKQHLRNLLSSDKNNKLTERESTLTTTFNGIHLDSTRQQCDDTTISKLINLANKANIVSKIESMYNGDKINKTENRSVLHIALRAPDNVKIVTPDNNEDQVPKVHKVLNQIKEFSNKVRSGEFLGASGQKLTNVISIGIGGSYLGAEFVFQALRTNNEARIAADGRTLRFHANIDPIGFARAVTGLNPENTLIIVVSKTFTTRETMMNATLVRDWLLSYYKTKDANLQSSDILSKHFIAVSANPTEPTAKFNIAKENIFEFWDWVGGRYSVTSAVGILPLSLHYGYDIMSSFLSGCRNIDEHFFNERKSLNNNIPALLGLLGVWNSTFLEYPTRALIPYCEALSRLPAHIQQLDMESNGKRVSISSIDKNTGMAKLVPYQCGEINFGEPGTNAQHSFFQLIHQGRIIPIDLIGFSKSQLTDGKNNNLYNDEISTLINNNHDELMSNFFAQADALAIGKTTDEVKAELEKSGKYDENTIKFLMTHKEFPGNRPSSLLLFDGSLNAFACGQLLSIFEHRTIVQGFLWDIGSFDQWGVELGKMLGKKVRSSIDSFRNDNGNYNRKDYNNNTVNVLNRYLEKSS